MSHKGRLASHVRASEKHNSSHVLAHLHIVGDEIVLLRCNPWMTKLFKLDKCRIRVDKCRPAGWGTNGSGRFSKREETIEFGSFAYGAQPNITVLVKNGVKAGSKTLD